MQLLLSNLAIILTDAIFTPHAHRERGKVIGLGVLIKTYFELYFSDRLTFSNIRGRTSH